MSFRLPWWLRMTAFALLLAVAIGAILTSLHQYVKPVTLKLAVGSLDGEAVRVMTAIGGRLAANKAAVRVTILDKGSPVEAARALATGEADLAVVRADNEELGSARAVVQLTNLVLMVLVPSDSSVQSIADLAGQEVGVVGLQANRTLLATIGKSYGFTPDTVRFIDVPYGELADAARSKRHQAAIFTVPISDRYLSIVRASFLGNGKNTPRLLAIEAAEAIALETKAYEAFDIPKGTLRGAPPLPDEAISTLRVPLFLVASAKVGEETVTALTRAIMEARRELMPDSPLLARVTAPEDGQDAAIPVHPGAKAYFDGSEKTWSDKYGDWLFYGPIVLGAVGSFLAGLWKFLTSDGGNRSSALLQRIAALTERSRKATSESELHAIEIESDEVLKDFLDAQVKRKIDDREIASVNLMIHHLESVIARRSHALATRPATPGGAVNAAV